jgi:Gram-negative bacterial TonB protein C-terminal
MGELQLASLMALAVLVQGAAPQVLERVEPVYPPLAFAARVEKTVKLSVRINPNGSVADIRVVDGHPLLNSTALDAVHGSSIGGTVQTTTGQGAESFVFLVPDATRRQNPLFYKAARSDPSGRFEINDVAPGDYTLFAFENRPPDGAMENAEFISRYEQRGARLTVRVSTPTPRVTVQIIPKS